jgi:hypothetical protein
VSKRQQNDAVKKEFAHRTGITLIPIPFWWNKSVESLTATIRTHRPDLLQYISASKDQAISTSIPLQHQRRFDYKPSQAVEYDESLDPTGW